MNVEAIGYKVIIYDSLKFKSKKKKKKGNIFNI